MSHREATNGEIMGSIRELKETVGTLSQSVGELKETVGDLAESVGFINGFIQEHLVTKSEHYDLQQEVKLCATKQELHEFKDEILTAIDASSNTFIRLDQEQTATSHQVTGLRDRMGKMEHHLGFAT